MIAHCYNVYVNIRNYIKLEYYLKYCIKVEQTIIYLHMYMHILNDYYVDSIKQRCRTRFLTYHFISLTRWVLKYYDNNNIWY